MSTLLWTETQAKIFYLFASLVFFYIFIWLITGEEGETPEELIIKGYRRLRGGDY